jgi:hypothetical protein
MLKIFRLLFFLGFGFAGLAVGTRAEDAPTHEKCTCDIGQRVGSTIVNAAACLRDRIGDWCDTYIVAIENSPGHDVLIARLVAGAQDADGVALFNLLLDSYERYVGAQKEISVPSFDRLVANYPTLKETLVKGMPQIQSCITKFLNGEQAGAEGIDYTCSVGAESGWLRITVRLGDGLFSFLFAPKR